MAQQAATLVPFEPAPGVPAADEIDREARALAVALAAAVEWSSEILALALAELGDVTLPPPVGRAADAGTLAALPVLYWVRGLDEAGVLRATETVAGLWASGAITVPLPDRGEALQNYWRTRKERLTANEREHLLGRVFDARDFDPAMQRLCDALVALADNAGQRDLREEVGLRVACETMLDLCARRLPGAPIMAAPDLLAQARAAVELLSQRALQSAFAVHDFYELIELSERTAGRRTGSARNAAERAQAGALVLRWLAQGGASRFRLDVQSSALQAVIAAAERWRLRYAPGSHERSGAGAIAA
jgi:hypothetical protein